MSITKVDYTSWVGGTDKSSFVTGAELKLVCASVSACTQLSSAQRQFKAQTEAALYAAESKWLIIADVVTYQDQQHLAAFFAPHLSTAPHDLKLCLTDDAKAEGLRWFNFIRPRLVYYWRPTIWIPLNALPMGTTGKMNRKLLKTFFHSLEPSLQDKVANLVRPFEHFVAVGSN